MIKFLICIILKINFRSRETLARMLMSECSYYLFKREHYNFNLILFTEKMTNIIATKILFKDECAQFFSSFSFNFLLEKNLGKFT